MEVLPEFNASFHGGSFASLRGRTPNRSRDSTGRLASELAAQVETAFRALSRFTSHRTGLVYGGERLP